MDATDAVSVLVCVMITSFNYTSCSSINFIIIKDVLGWTLKLNLYCIDRYILT
jgi:hypothetical protein